MGFVRFLKWIFTNLTFFLSVVVSLEAIKPEGQPETIIDNIDEVLSFEVQPFPGSHVLVQMFLLPRLAMSVRLQLMW